jgi:hypothetical protein
MLVIRDVVVDPVLSNVSKAYQNEMYISEMIMPSMKVGTENGKYYQYDRAKFRRNTTKRAAGAKANEVEHGLSTASYSTEDHALKEKTPWEIIRQADTALAPERDATENVTEQLLIDKEVALATSMAATATITQNTTLSGTSQWSDYTNSDPIGDVKTAVTTVQKSIGRKPNTMIVGKEVFDKLADHPDIIEKVKYSQLGVLTEELLARVFNVQKVIVAEAIYNTATEGATDSMSYIWGKHAWLVYITPAARLRSITLGFTFKYEDRKTKKWDDEDAEARFVRVNENYVQKFVATEAAYLIKNAVA